MTQARWIVFALLSLSLSTSASAGLFGSVGRALGIGGDVGKALNAADRLLPGGGGVTDDILGAPGKAAFGSAIKDWEAANGRTIKQLGETNDRTVDKLLQGLNGIKEDFSADMDKLADALSQSVSALDESLDRNIQLLDNNLTGNTGQLDTVFQKQTNTMFFLGRVFLTVLLAGGAAFTIMQLFSRAKSREDISAIINNRRYSLGGTAAVAVIGMILAWVWPDPSRLGAVEEQYRTSLRTSLGFEDFAKAYNDSSQLVVIDPSDPEFQSLKLKSKSLRDLFLRPTTVLDDQRLATVFAQLAQADQYHRKGSDVGDPDAVALYALFSTTKSRTPGGLLSAAIAAAEAERLYTDVKNKNWITVEPLRLQNRATLQLLQQQALPAEFVKLAFKGSMPKDPSAEEAVIDEYERFRNQPLSASSTNDKSPSLGAISSVSQFGSLLQDKISIKTMYAQLSARYFDFLIKTSVARATGATAQDASSANDAYCALFEEYRDWYTKTGADEQDEAAFVSNVLSGPFGILARAQVISGAAANPCNGVSAAEIAKYADQATLWLNPLQDSLTQDKKRGIALIRAAATISLDRQNKAFSDYEAKALALGPLFRGATSDPAAAQQFSDFIDETAILGLSTLTSDKKTEPAVFSLYKKYRNAMPAGVVNWQRAFTRYLQSETI